MIIPLLLLFPPLADASFLWKISDTTPPSYLFGTIHVPYTLVWDAVPESAKKAFGAAENVYLEVLQYAKEEVLHQPDCRLLPEGKKLDLPPDIAEQLTPELQRLRPEWILLALSRETGSSDTEPTLDDFLEFEAKTMGKRLGALETDEDLCEAINDSFEPAQVLFLLNHTLAWVEMMQLEKESSDLNKLISDYRMGLDSAAEDSILNEKDNSEVSPEERKMMYEIYTIFEKNLLGKRDPGMTERILQELRERPNESHFFAVGMAHLVGSANTIVDRLRVAGIKVQRVEYTYSKGGLMVLPSAVLVFMSATLTIAVIFLLH